MANTSTSFFSYNTIWIPSTTSMLDAAGRAWPYIVGGYDTWRKGRHPMSNAYAFYGLCDETRLATMLEF